MERKVRMTNEWTSPIVGDELVSRIPYQCNNRSKSLTSRSIHPLQVVLLTLLSLTLSPIGLIRHDVALHVSWCQNRFPKCGEGGGLCTPRLSGSKKFYKNFRRGSTCPSPESLHPNPPYILDYNPRSLYLNSHLLCRRFLWYTHLQPFYSIFQCS